MRFHTTRIVKPVIYWILFSRLLAADTGAWNIFLPWGFILLHARNIKGEEAITISFEGQFRKKVFDSKGLMPLFSLFLSLVAPGPAINIKFASINVEKRGMIDCKLRKKNIFLFATSFFNVFSFSSPSYWGDENLLLRLSGAEKKTSHLCVCLNTNIKRGRFFFLRTH